MKRLASTIVKIVAGVAFGLVAGILAGDATEGVAYALMATFVIFGWGPTKKLQPPFLLLNLPVFIVMLIVRFMIALVAGVFFMLYEIVMSIVEIVSEKKEGYNVEE